MKFSPLLLITILALGCSDSDFGRDYVNDPIVSINLSERRGTERIDSRIDRSGNFFRGYSEDSSDYFEKSVVVELSPEITTQLWKAVDSDLFPEEFSSQESSGDFRSIGATWHKPWKGGVDSYGVSAEYSRLEPGSPLFDTLQIIRENKIDIWEVPPGIESPVDESLKNEAE